MKRLRLLLVLVPSLVLATEIKPQTPEFLGEDVAAFIKQQNRTVLVDTSKGETVWTDGSMVERNKRFPKSITAMLRAPSSERTLDAGKVAALIDGFQQQRDGYLEGTIERVGTECFAVNGATRALVNCLYVDYLRSRYFKAKFFVRAPSEPVLLVEKTRVHALLLPTKR